MSEPIAIGTLHIPLIPRRGGRASNWCSLSPLISPHVHGQDIVVLLVVVELLGEEDWDVLDRVWGAITLKLGRLGDGLELLAIVARNRRLIVHHMGRPGHAAEVLQVANLTE
jgi:hypothetical protein